MTNQTERTAIPEALPAGAAIPPKKQNKGLSARTKQKIKQNIVGYLYVMPVILGVLIFTAFPVVYAFVASFFEGTLYFDDLGVFRGLKNYTDIFTNFTYRKEFLQTLKITFGYAAVSIPLTLVLGFLLAVLLNSELKGMRIYRVIYYLPVLIPPICSGLLWGRITDPQIGVLNALLAKVGITGLTWFKAAKSSMPSFVFINMFGLGGNMILWLAQLKNVPRSLYESAQLDGASKARQLFTITIPMCAPMILYNTITSIIGVLQTYSQVVMLVGDGQGVQNSLFFYVSNIYNYRVNKFGYACALSFILFLIIGVLSFFVMKMNKFIYYSEEG